MPVQIDETASLGALRSAAGRVADLVRDVREPDRRAGHLDWTIAETAAHLVGGGELYTGFITGERDAHHYLSAATHVNRRGHAGRPGCAVSG